MTVFNTENNKYKNNLLDDIPMTWNQFTFIFRSHPDSHTNICRCLRSIWNSFILSDGTSSIRDQFRNWPSFVGRFAHFSFHRRSFHRRSEIGSSPGFNTIHRWKNVTLNLHISYFLHLFFLRLSEELHGTVLLASVIFWISNRRALTMGYGS